MYYDYEPEYIKEERKREAERNRFLTRHSDLQHSLQYPSSDHHKDEEIDLSFYGNGARIPVDRKEELLRVLIHLKKHPYAKRIVFPDVKIENNTVSGIEIEVESRFCELLIHSPNIIQINNCQDLFQDEKSSLAKLVKINRKIGEYLDPKKNCHFLNFQNLLFVDAVTPTLNRILKAIKENDSVRELNLMNAALTSAHVPVLCEILRSSKNLVSFSIGSKSTVDACQNKLTNEDIKLLLAAIRENPDSPLQYLDISYNNVKPGLVEDVVVFLKEHKKITYLNLAGCSVDDSGMKILSEYLKINTVLSVLNLDANLFQGPGLLFLLDALKVNRCICELSLLTNQVPEATVESFIKELATVNRAIHDLKMTHVSHQPKRSYREKNIDYPMRIKTALGHFNDTNKTLSDRAVVSAMSGSLDDFIQKLIQRISPYIKNGEGKSLLQILVENEHLGHIAYLRSQGFYMDLLTPELVSMLDYAKSLNKSEVTNVLRGAASIINSSRLAFPPSPSLTATSPNTAKGKKHARAETDPKQQTLFGAWARDEAKRAKKATDPTPTNSLSEQAPVILPVPTAAAPENNTDTDVQSYAKFYYAVCYWQLNIIRECLERGLAVHANQPPGSPWFALANFPNQEIAELFISKLENINVTNLNGRHLLHELCLQSLDLNLAELLLSREIGVDSLDSISATPLFYAAGGCQTAISHEDYKKRANVIRALLKAGANPRKLFFDYANQVGNSTVLHIVVSLGNYDAAKALLQFAPDLVNMPNALGEVPLHIAARNKDMDLLDLLLSQPGVAMHRQNQANQTAFELLAGNDESSKAARTLFEKYMKAIIPPLHTQILWGNPLKLFFGGRASKNKAVSYDATVIHGNLHSSLQSVLQQPGNQAMAELAFLVKSTDGQRRVVPVPMTFMPQYHVTQGWQATERILPDTQSRFSMVRSPDAFGRLKHRLQSVPDDVKVQCVSDPDDEQHPLSESAVSDLYLRADRIYEQRIHHSEVGLADHLENLTTIGEIITKLLQNAVEFPIGSKVYAVVLNIASKFYLCANCRMTLLGLQNPEKSEFLRNLTDKLQHAGFRTPVHRSLPMVTLFSAKIPYPRGTVKTSEQQHSDLEVDPRRYSSNNLILQADPESLNKLTSFNSRKG